jgi:diguanylate cyclase (GGDEF)-like protein/PAS domain S-box-containing protein
VDRKLPNAKLSLQTRQETLRRLLAGHPDAIVAALADNGSRIPLPEAFPTDGYQALAVPPEAATMLHVVAAPDRMMVVTVWEKARQDGAGMASVHALSDPDTRMTLSIVDARDFYGAWIAVLIPQATDFGPTSPVLAGALLVPSRPRQATMHKSMTAVITEVDANVTAMLGWTPEQVIGSRTVEFIHPEDHERAVASWMQLLSDQGSQRIRVRQRCADESYLWIEVEHVHNGATDPDEVDVIAHINDISDEMAAHETVRRREQLFSRLAEALPTGVVQLSQAGAVVYSNTRLGDILRTGRLSSAPELLATVVPEDRAAVRAAVVAALQRGVDGELEARICSPDARTARLVAVTIAAVVDQEDQPGALICVTDVTESARMREELKLRATQDSLTGCLNRSTVMLALDHLVDHHDHGIVAIFVDLDNFKPVNDKFGHAAGDELLIGLARRLQALSREHDLVARLGGDEFLLVCCNLESRDQAAVVAERVRAAFAHPISISPGEFEVQASIGVAWREVGMSAEALVAHADAAMYESKRQNDGQPAYFAAELPQVR